MVSAKSLIRNMGVSLLLVLWCLSINYAPVYAAQTSTQSTSAKIPEATKSHHHLKQPKAAGSAPQPRSFGGYGGHDLFDRGFSGHELLPILAIIGFAVIFLPVIGALFASMTQLAAPVGYPLNQAVTTATVAGRKKREVQDQTVLTLLKGMEKFYRGFKIGAGAKGI